MSKKITHKMIESLITSGTRIKLLLKFFLNPEMTGYLRQLSSEFGESTNSIRVELNKLKKAKILTSAPKGRNIIYTANKEHPLFDDIRNIILKSTGIDKVLTNIIQKMGDLKMAFLRGDYAVGNDTGLIDLVLIGDNLNLEELERVRTKTEGLINRKISVLILNQNEYNKLKETFSKEKKMILFKHK